MPRSIEWRYHRLNCLSCAKAEAFLAEAGISTVEQVNARKVSISPDEALVMIAGLRTLIAVRGKKVVEIDLTQDRPDDDALCALIIGRTGSLRAPALRFSGTLVVGFEEATYRRLLG